MNVYRKITLTVSLALLSYAVSLSGDDLFVDPSTINAPASSTPVSKTETATTVAPPSGLQSETDADRVKQTIDNQLAAIRTFDVSKAYYAYTTKEFQKSTSLDTFKQFVKKYSVLFRNKRATEKSIKFKGNVATYQGTLLSTDGDQYHVEIVLIYTEEEWKIHSIQLSQMTTPNVTRTLSR